MGSFGVKSVMFGGEGEPMLHPNIASFVDAAKASGMDVAFTTNGTKMDVKFSLSCLADISWIKISCNGGTPSAYADIHKSSKKDWDNLWSNIAFAIRYRYMWDLKLKIGVQLLVLPENIRTIPSLLEKCMEVGVDYLVLKPYSHNPDSKTKLYKDLDYSPYNFYLHGLKREFDKKFVSSKFEFIIRESAFKSVSTPFEYSKCRAVPYFWSYIRSNGEVYGCSTHLNNPNFSYGNINSSSFSRIWLGRARSKAKKFMTTFCLDGSCRKACRMNSTNKFLESFNNETEHRNFI
jgi:radical SAM protein with 4Fe4S-binding SPASM domain